jgi:hypothetical protein
MAWMQGKQWVVTSTQYKIIDDNVSNNSQDTILTLGIVAFVVKIIAFGKIATIVSRLVTTVLLLGIAPFNIGQQCSICYRMRAFNVTGETHIQ